MIEPGLEGTLARQLQEEAAAAVDWAGWRKCSGCGAEIGEACWSLSGTIVGGRPDGVRTSLTHAHAARQRRTGR